MFSRFSRKPTCDRHIQTQTDGHWPIALYRASIAKKTNEWVLNKAGVKRELLDTVKARKLAYYGHTMRKQAVVKLLSKRWWIPVVERLEGPKLEPEGPNAEVRFPTAD